MALLWTKYNLDAFSGPKQNRYNLQTGKLGAWKTSHKHNKDTYRNSHLACEQMQGPWTPPMVHPPAIFVCLFLTCSHTRWKPCRWLVLVVFVWSLGSAELTPLLLDSVGILGFAVLDWDTITKISKLHKKWTSMQILNGKNANHFGVCDLKTQSRLWKF